MMVYTVGTFDVLHVGHLALLEYCKTLGDVVAVGVASDSVVNSYKPNVPIIPLDQRIEMLKALRCVDIVRPYHELEYVSACKDLNPDIFVIGEDWGDNPHNLDVEHYLKSEGKQIVQVNYNPRTSSTEIKRNVMSQAAARGLTDVAPDRSPVLRRVAETDGHARTSRV
ncbi:adenylyltransferase/cytidyltransferase family protein [Magnetovibrio sp. PR-2]|uniref:adenylyltransferase/cytidyltransferase family protein n=1 Tax=Magnetovibrio sp. PR-2 TaxID=3120356 RepID=UPI002FCDF8A0